MGLSVFATGNAGAVAETVAGHLDCDCGRVQEHLFPDGETLVRVNPDTVTDTVAIVAGLDRPNPRMIPLLFLAELLRQCGAAHLLLIAPYLPYMRQDRQFNPGEGISAFYFARLLSHYFDALVTVDPHLHRVHSLDELYSIPARAVAAAPSVADWIRNNVEQPLLIGPDSESAQWVEDLARRTDCPFTVLEKIRRGDRRVEVSIPDVERWSRHTPVLYDDMISTGRTMAETVGHLRQAGLRAPVCIAVHGVFADAADRILLEAGADRVVTTNTIPHATNAVDLAGPLAHATRELIARL